jgi:hypothetical protein
MRPDDITRGRVRINIFSIAYLVMCIERRHDYDFSTRARTLGVLSAERPTWPEPMTEGETK